LNRAKLWRSQVETLVDHHGATTSGAWIGASARRSASSTRRGNSPCSNQRSACRILFAGIVFGSNPEQTSAVWRQDERDRREIDRAAALFGRSTRNLARLLTTPTHVAFRMSILDLEMIKGIIVVRLI